MHLDTKIIVFFINLPTFAIKILGNISKQPQDYYSYLLQCTGAW